MQPVFSFFFRLFFAFIAAKLLSIFFGLPGLGSLIGLTCLILGNVYLFDYLDYRSRTAWRRSHGINKSDSVLPVPPSSSKETSEA